MGEKCRHKEQEVQRAGGVSRNSHSCHRLMVRHADTESSWRLARLASAVPSPGKGGKLAQDNNEGTCRGHRTDGEWLAKGTLLSAAPCGPGEGAGHRAGGARRAGRVWTVRKESEQWAGAMGSHGWFWNWERNDPGRVIRSLCDAVLSLPHLPPCAAIQSPHPPPPLLVRHTKKPCVTVGNVKIYMPPKSNNRLTVRSYKYSDGAEMFLRSHFLLPCLLGEGLRKRKEKGPAFAS